MQVDIANLPTGQNANGYAISLSEEATRIRITSTECESGAGTSSCRLWTIRPDADAAPGTYAFTVRASGTITRAPGDATIRVVALEDVVATRAVIAASLHHVVTADGRLWGRGLNFYGATGVNFESVGFDVDDSFLLPDVIENFVRVGTDTDWSAVVSDGASVIALKTNGTVWGWGRNLRIDLSDAFYQFGFSSELIGKIETSIQLRPRQIAGLPPIKAISANDGRFLALARDDGTVYGFGGGSADFIVRQTPGGITSRRTDEPQAVPVSVDGTPLRNIVAISGGVQNSGRGWAMALDANGKVWQMGRHGSTFVADGPADAAVETAAMPRLVALEATVVAVAAGDAFSVAATNAGEVWSWTEGDLTPRQVQGLSGIVALDSNGEDVSALDTQGRVWIISNFGVGAPRQ
ncbi:MAG: RCC1 domain-containing protein, partial [Burkholderiales bacterium]